MKVFVAGATGQTGSRIVKELVSRQISVVALVRDENKAREILPSEIELVVGDVLKPESWADKITGCNLLICATGATPSWDFTAFYQVDYQGTKNLIDLAKQNQIEKFIFVTSLCVSRFFHPLNLFGLVLYWKKQAEKDLINSGLVYTIVRPGGLKNEENDNAIVMSRADTLFDGSIPRSKVAQVCVESIFHPETNNQIVEIVAKPDAPEQNWDELFAVLS